MNSILDEITYSDGRMDDVVKSLYTPAKLKLRAKTYEGINRNLNARRNPVMESPAFSIPNAFMAVEVPSGTEGGSGYSVIEQTGLESVKFETNPKKLKVSQRQISGLATHNTSTVEENPVEVQPAVEEQITPEINVSETVQPVINEIPSIPNVEEKQEVQVSEPTPVEEIKEETNIVPEEKEVPVAPIVDPLDAAREKVLNTTPTTKVEVNEPAQDVIEQAEDTDVFKQLEQATNEYSRVDQDFKKSIEAYQKAQQDLETSKNDFERIEDDIERTSAKIEERNETIDSANKEIENIKIRSEEIDKSIRAKIRLVNSAKERKIKEQKETEQNTSRVMDENKNYQDRIQSSKLRAQELEEKERRLELEENQLIEAKQAAMEKLNSKMAILEAITLPEGIELDNSMEEVSSFQEVPAFTNENKVNEEDYQYVKKMTA